MSKKHKITFEQIAQNWLNDVELRVKPSTLENYRYLLRRHILPIFGDVDMRRLSPEKVNCFVENKLKHGRLRGKGELSRKYLKDIVSIIRSVAKYAAQMYDIPNKVHCKIRSERRETRVLKGSERARLAKRLMTDPSGYDFGILTSMSTGLRIGEICGLTWGDFDENDKLIHVRRTVQRVSDNNGSTRLLIGEPKTASSVRIIPLPDFLYEVLKRYKKSSETYIASETASPAEPAKLRRYFKQITEECRIKDIRFHDLRHSFATECVKLEFDIKSLSEILGHSNVTMTLNRYVHSSIEMKRKFMNLLKI